jgi:hypothetical protein
MFIFCVYIVPCRKRSLRRADHSFRGVLVAVCGCVYLIVCELQTPTMMQPSLEFGCRATEKQQINSKVCVRKPIFFYNMPVSVVKD